MNYIQNRKQLTKFQPTYISQHTTKRCTLILKLALVVYILNSFSHMFTLLKCHNQQIKSRSSLSHLLNHYCCSSLPYQMITPHLISTIHYIHPSILSSLYSYHLFFRISSTYHNIPCSLYSPTLFCPVDTFTQLIL